jgi:NADH dehydrogenase FAD-containing subunit
VVLVGLGHAHLFVLEAAAAGRLPCELIVCTADDEHLYSGMVSGWIRGAYARSDIALPIAALVQRAGATLVPHHVTALRAADRTVELTDGRPVTGDVISVAVGSALAGRALPGVREYAVGVRPLEGLAPVLQRLREGELSSLLVVGGGVAAAELALAFAAAARRAPGATPAVSVAMRDARIAAERGRGVSRRLTAALAAAGVRVHAGFSVEHATRDGVVGRRDGSPVQLAAQQVVWATGPAAPAWLSLSDVARDAEGFMVVDDHLRSTSHPWVLAAGDVATLATVPQRPRAGVFAVRMGPVLVHSIRAALGVGLPARPYRPQRHWLSLVDLADGRALASWGPFVASGAWAMALKRRIDQRFVRRFSRLAG